MKIIGISDIHGLLIDAKSFPQGDVLCIAGDISPLKAQRNMPQMLSWLQKRFVPWIESLPVDKVFLVAGNHDFIFEHKDFFCAAIDSIQESGKLVYLNDSYVTYNEKQFYGSPWVVGPKGWAFYDETQKLKMIELSMPDDVDVAIFHQPLEYGGNGKVLQVPSWMIGSTLPTDILKNEESLHPSFGSTALDNIVEMKKPKLVLTGHVHSGNHELISFGDSMIANVSILDEDYKQKYQPFEITL